MRPREKDPGRTTREERCPSCHSVNVTPIGWNDRVGIDAHDRVPYDCLDCRRPFVRLISQP